MSTGAWATLADTLRNRYPDDWAERYASYKDGTNPDLQRWQQIGGELFSPQFAERNHRIREAARHGVPLTLLAERFGLTKPAIGNILARFGERASR